MYSVNVVNAVRDRVRDETRGRTRDDDADDNDYFFLSATARARSS